MQQLLLVVCRGGIGSRLEKSRYCCYCGYAFEAEAVGAAAAVETKNLIPPQEVVECALLRFAEMLKS